MATTEDTKDPAAESPTPQPAAAALTTPVPGPETETSGEGPPSAPAATRRPSSVAHRSPPSLASVAASEVVANEDASSKPFIPKQPIREEMVRQAVSFLTHPKVKGSPIKFRRAFLEKKGLTGDEIDKAFQQVPDEATGDASTDTSAAGSTYITSHAARSSAAAPPGTATVTAPAAAAGVPQTATASVGPPQHPSPGVGAPGMPYGHQHPMQGASGMPMVYPGQQVQPARKWTWGQMAVALAVVGAAGAGTAALAQRFAWPRFKLWLLQQLKEEQKGQDGDSTQAGNTAAAGEGAAAGDKESLGALVAELKTMAAELKSAREGRSAELSSADIRKEVLSCMSVMKDFQPGALASESQPHSPLDPYTNEADRFLARAGKGPAQTQGQGQGQGAPGDAERAKRLEREVEDLKRLLRSRGAQGTPQDPSYPQGASSAFPSSVNSFSSGPGYTTAYGSGGHVPSTGTGGGVSPGLGSGYGGTPGLAPGAAGAGGNGVAPPSGPSGYGDRRQGGLSLSSSTSSLTGLPQVPAGATPSEAQAADGAYEAPMSKSYMEILDMVRRGETPPGIRDINDKPPNPNQPLSASQLAPRAKPWDQQQAMHAASAAGRPGPLPGARAQAGASTPGVPPWLRGPTGNQSPNPSAGLNAGYSPYGGTAGQGQGALGLGQVPPGAAAPSAEALASAAALGGGAAALYNAQAPDTWQRAAPAAGSAPGAGVYQGQTQGPPVPAEAQQVSGIAGVEPQPLNPSGFPDTAGIPAAGAGGPTGSGAGGVVPAAYQSVSTSSWVPPSVPKPAMAEAAAAMRRFPPQGQSPWLNSMGAGGAPRAAQGLPAPGAGSGGGGEDGVAQGAQQNGVTDPAANGVPGEHQGLSNGVGSSSGPSGPGLEGFPTPAEAYKRQAGGPPPANQPHTDTPVGPTSQGPSTGEPLDFSYGSAVYGDGSSGGGAHGGPPRAGAGSYGASSSGAGAHGGHLGPGAYGARAGAYGSVSSGAGAHGGPGSSGPGAYGPGTAAGGASEAGAGPSGAGADAYGSVSSGAGAHGGHTGTGAPEAGAGPSGPGPKVGEPGHLGIASGPAAGVPFPPEAGQEGEARGGEGGGAGGMGSGGGQGETGHAPGPEEGKA